MRESVIYQEILQRGEIKMLLRQLNRRFGAIAPDLQTQIQQLSIPQLELGEALLDFSAIADLTAWLETYQSPEESSSIGVEFFV